LRAHRDAIRDRVPARNARSFCAFDSQEDIRGNEALAARMRSYRDDFEVLASRSHSFMCGSASRDQVAREEKAKAKENEVMKKFAKYALAAAAIAGAAIVTTAPADARVFVGVGVGPGYYGPGPGPGYSCDPYSRWYDPYYCDGYYGGPGYYGPAFGGVYFGSGWGGHGGHWGRGGGHWGHGGGGHWGGGHHH
jgi:hypothetical protein